MAAENDGQGAVAAKPGFGLIQAFRRHVNQATEPALEQSMAVVPGEQVEVGGAENDGGDHAEPVEEQPKWPTGAGLPQIEHEYVTGERAGQPRFFQVEDEETGRRSQAGDAASDSGGYFSESLRNITLDQGDQEQSQHNRTGCDPDAPA